MMNVIKVVMVFGLCVLLVSCVPWMSVQTTDDGYVLCAEVKPHPESKPVSSAPVKDVPPWAPSTKFVPMHTDGLK